MLGEDHMERIEPGPGQESAWDYPRPPRVEPTAKWIRVVFNGATIAETGAALRVLETGHPPVYYIPMRDIELDRLHPTSKTTVCEYKGVADYYDIEVGGKVSRNAAWTYHHPDAGYEAIADHIAFYPWAVDEALVDGERAEPQPGHFYGGWITRDVVGPFRGEPGATG